MKKKYCFLISIIFWLNSCYDEEDFSPTSLNNIMDIEVVNNNALADSESKITVKAGFPSDFETEDDGKVDFLIFKSPEETLSSEIQFVQVDQINKKEASLDISNLQAGELNVRIKISINKAIISKDTTITFFNAFPESLRQSVSSALVKPNNFDKIEINTRLERGKGVVSKGTKIDLKIVDTLGISRGRLDDLILKTDELGTIQNSYSMGEDSYIGQLYLISSTLAEDGTTIKDSLVLISRE